MIRVLPRTVVPPAEWNDRQVRRLLAQSVRPRMGPPPRHASYHTGLGLDPLQVRRIAGFTVSTSANEWRRGHARIGVEWVHS